MTFNPYNTLEVSTSATEQEIKKAYRKLSIKYHPDRVKDSDPERDQKVEKFTRLTESKDLLLDSELRRAYNRGGWDMVNHVKDSKRQMEQRNMKCETLTIEMVVSLKQLYYNETVKVTVPVPIYHEDGTRTVEQFPMEFGLQGLGKVVAENSGVQRPNKTPGDIVVITKLPDDCPFVIRQLDLIYNAKLSLVDLIDGYTITVPHPSGNYNFTGKYTFADGDNDNIYIFPGMGMKHEYMKGDLVINCTIDLSELEQLDEDTKQVIRNLFKRKQQAEATLDITGLSKTPQQMRQRQGQSMGMGMGMGIPSQLLEMDGPGCPVQ